MINCIIVDDEEGCISNLQHYLKAHCPLINVIGTATDTESAGRLMNTLSIDLAFLDVHLFDRTIFELLADINTQNFSIVFVTAYEQYALKAFKVSALDYLLKPLEKAEILRCYEKVEQHFRAVETHETTTPEPKTSRIVLRHGEHVYLICTNDIVYLKANGFYTNVCFEYEGKLKNIVISKPLNMVFKEWESSLLMRVHRSYAVNRKRVHSVKKHGTGLLLQIGDILIPVAKRRTEDFINNYEYSAA